MHLGFGYEQDMWRILMQIAIVLHKATQKQAPGPCYSMNIHGKAAYGSLIHPWYIWYALHACGAPVHHGYVPYSRHALSHMRRGNYQLWQVNHQTHSI